MLSKKWVFFVFALLFSLTLLAVATSTRSTIHQPFTPDAVTFELPHNPAWNSEPLTAEKEAYIEHILQQSFTYLSQGAQSFAFLSEDKRFVMKFFKSPSQEPTWWEQALPGNRKKKRGAIETVLNGYKLAYEIDPVQTGTLFIHLNPDNTGFFPLLVQDQAGKQHIVNLNNTRFVIQEYAIELEGLLEEALQQGNLDLTKQLLSQTVDYYSQAFHKGLYDLGRGLIQNNGFLDGHVIHFDVSKLTVDPRTAEPFFQKQVLHELVDNADRWFAKHAPQHREEMIAYLRNQIDTCNLSCR